MTAQLVVTGASGYVGSYLLRAAARRGYRTKGLVRARVPWMAADLQQPTTSLTEPGLLFDGADVVVHLAAPNETAFQSEPAEALEQTVLASQGVARACARSGVRRLFYVSTVHVYGSALQPGAAITEHTAAAPLGDYGRSRLLSEEAVCREAGAVQVVILRLTNGVGAPVSPLVDRWTLVANDLCRQSAETGRMRLAQPGQWRDFIPLDAVAAVVLDASDPAHEEALPAGTYNLSAGRCITILDLAKLIKGEAEQMGISVSIDAPAALPAAPYRVDNTKIRKTGLLPEDLSVSRSIRNTLELCVGVLGDRRSSTPLGS